MKINKPFVCISYLSIERIKSVLDDLVGNDDLLLYAFVKRQDFVVLFIDPRHNVNVTGLLYLLESETFIECGFDEWCDKFNYTDTISVCISKRYVHTLEVY